MSNQKPPYAFHSIFSFCTDGHHTVAVVITVTHTGEKKQTSVRVLFSNASAKPVGLNNEIRVAFNNLSYFCILTPIQLSVSGFVR